MLRFSPLALMFQMDTVHQLVDGRTDTKWLDFYKGKNGVVFQFNPPVILTAYEWATADDHPERDPVRWKMESSGCWEHRRASASIGEHRHEHRRASARASRAISASIAKVLGKHPAAGPVGYKLQVVWLSLLTQGSCLVSFG